MPEVKKKPLQPLRVLVTGGCGFIGSNFVRHLLSVTNAEVLNLDLLTYAGNINTINDILREPRHTLVQGDIADGALVSGLLADFKPECVVNFAAESHVDRSIDGPAKFIETNIVGTFVLLEHSLAYWQTLQPSQQAKFRFLQISTDEVFGSLGEEGLFTEETPYSPNSPYSASKAASDHLVRAWHHTYSLPTITTNCSNNYGPFQFPEKLVPLMILNGLDGKPLPLYGDGGNVRDWLYVEDHCRAIWAVLRYGEPGEIYNVGGGSERTNLAVVNTICELLDELAADSPHCPHAKLKTSVTDRPGHDRRYAIDARKITTQLGWRPRETFETGMRRTVQWYVQNRDWCTAVAEDCCERERLGLGVTRGIQQK